MSPPSTRQIWRDDIHDWLTNGPNEGPPFTKAQLARCLRIRSDQRLVPVARRLEGIKSFARLETFLAIVIGLPESFTYFKDKSPDFLDKEVEAVKIGTSGFLSIILQNQDLIEHYLSPDDGKNYESYKVGAIHFKTLESLIRIIKKEAETGRHVIPPDCVPKVSRKRNVEVAEKRFCIKQLSNTAIKFYKKRMHKEVGLLITVAMDLKAVIDADEVREIVRDS